MNSTLFKTAYGFGLVSLFVLEEGGWGMGPSAESGLKMIDRLVLISEFFLGFVHFHSISFSSVCNTAGKREYYPQIFLADLRIS